MKKFLLVAMVTVGCGAAFAQPASFIDLGNIGDIDPNYQTEDAFGLVDPFAAGQIQWFKFTFGGTNGTTNYLDIDTINPVGTSPSSALVDTEIGLYDNLGNRVNNDDDDGFSLYSSLTFGAAGSRQFTQSGTMTARIAANGRDGVLTSGTYWVAVGSFDTIFGATNWTVTGGAADTDRTRLAFRTDVAAVPEPFSMVAMGAGLLALARRRRNAK